MRVYPIQSSNIVHIGYDRPSSVLLVEFTAGQWYRYVGVEVKVFGELLSAKSVGSAFYTLVKANPARYPYAKVDVELTEVENGTVGLAEIV